MLLKIDNLTIRKENDSIIVEIGEESTKLDKESALLLSKNLRDFVKLIGTEQDTLN